MATDVEEVVVDADAVGAERLLPHRERRRARGRWTPRPAPWLRARRAEDLGQRRQRVAVDLAVGRVRQVVEHDDVAGHHDVGQVLAQPGLDGRRLDHGVGGRRHVADELLVAGRLLAHHDDALAHARIGAELRLDLAELDAVAADLHLMVAAAEELDDRRAVVVAAPAGEVAR